MPIVRLYSDALIPNLRFAAIQKLREDCDESNGEWNWDYEKYTLKRDKLGKYTHSCTIFTTSDTGLAGSTITQVCHPIF